MTTSTQRNLKNARRQFREAPLRASAKGNDKAHAAANGSAHANGQPPGPAKAESRPLKLGWLQPSATNPRQTFDEAALAELTASIRVHGVLNPLTVRPLKASGKCSNGTGSEIAGYEIVAGERRFWAAQRAGLDEVPCQVMELTDLQALEVQIVENDVRSDLAPLERLAGYQAMIDQHGYTVEDLAAKVGRSVSTIRNLLKLALLPRLAKDFVESGRLPVATAQLIARVPSDSHRERVAACVLAGNMIQPHWFASLDPKQIFKPLQLEVDPLSYRDTKQLIESCCMVELKSATFSRIELNLVPGVTSCDLCPKRVGNLQAEDPEGYAGCRADVCTDPPCYRSKVEAWQQRTAAAATAGGARLLDGKEVERVFRYGDQLAADAPYVDLAEPCWDDRKPKKPRSYQQLVGKQLKNDVVLAFDRAGALHRLVPKDRAREVLKADHKIDNGPQANGRAASSPAEKKRQAEQKVRGQVGRRCVAALVGHAEALWKAAAPSLLVHRGPIEDALRAVIPPLATELWGTMQTEVLKRRGIASGHQKEQVAGFVKLVEEELDGPQLFGLLCELASTKELTSTWSLKEHREALLIAFDVDCAAVEKEVRAERNGKAIRKGPSGDEEDE